MPRTAKRPGANRTDLLVPGPNRPAPGQGQPNGQPVRLPTGLPYGERQQLAQAQQAVPLSVSPQPAQGAPAQPLDIGSAVQAARNMEMPSLTAPHAPSERPGEPVTTGLPGGPQPTAIGAQTGNLSTMLQTLSNATGNPALSELAGRAQGLGQ